MYIIFIPDFTILMLIGKHKARYDFLSFIKYDLKASITVFFVALPLCLGISLFPQ
ncbi:MAG: hypothetical protein ABIQ11_10505 [Saprospiraceae bacterium]